MRSWGGEYGGACKKMHRIGTPWRSDLKTREDRRRRSIVEHRVIRPSVAEVEMMADQATEPDVTMRQGETRNENESRE